jgi:dUTP pyrophosphatase
MTVPVLLLRLDPDLPIPQYAHPGDAGADLYARDEVVLDPGRRASVATGVAVALPAGYVGLVTPRSGLARRHGLSMVNAPGVIDAGYRGEISLVLVNHDPATPVHLHRGDRVGQLLVMPVAEARFIEVERLPESIRGSGGFGSSGR